MVTIAQSGLSAAGVPVSTRADVAAAIDAVNIISGVPTARVGAKGWLETFIGPGFEAAHQLVSMSTHGCSGGVFATRSSDQAQAGAMSGYAVGGFALNDNTAYLQTSYGAYYEATRYPGAFNTHGVEVAMANLGSRVTQTPYRMIPDGITPGLWLSTFTSRVPGLTATDPSVAIGILGGSGPKWASGIVFSVNSVAAGVEGHPNPIALDMPRAYSVIWRNPTDGNPTGLIRSDCTATASAGAGGSIVFYDGGVAHQSANGNEQITVSNAGVLMGKLTISGTSATAGYAAFTGGVGVAFSTAYASDAAAAAGGIGSSQLYLRSDGSIHIRLS